MNYSEIVFNKALPKGHGKYWFYEYGRGFSRAMRYGYTKRHGWELKGITGRRKSVKRRMMQSIRDLQNP